MVGLKKRRKWREVETEKKRTREKAEEARVGSKRELQRKRAKSGNIKIQEQKHFDNSHNK